MSEPPTAPTAESQRDQLAHREAAMRWALDQCLLVVLDRIDPADPNIDYADFVKAIRAAHPDLMPPPLSPLDAHHPAAQSRPERVWLLTESLERLAETIAALDSPEQADYINSIRTDNVRLAAENARFRGLMAADPEVLRDWGNGLGIKHWAVRLLTFGFAEHFKESGAKNFVTVDVNPADLPPLVVTIQKKDGVSPAERIAQLEAQVVALTAQLGDAP